jgi:hypothetical protein
MAQSYIRLEHFVATVLNRFFLLKYFSLTTLTQVDFRRMILTPSRL